MKGKVRRGKTECGFGGFPRAVPAADQGAKIHAAGTMFRPFRRRHDKPGQVQEGAFIHAFQHKKPPRHISGVEGLNGFRLKLGITAGYHNAGTGVIPQGFADKPPGLLVRFGGDGTGIDDENIRRGGMIGFGFAPGAQGKARLGKSAGQRFAFKLIQLAAKGMYRCGKHAV